MHFYCIIGLTLFQLRKLKYTLFSIIYCFNRDFEHYFSYIKKSASAIASEIASKKLHLHALLSILDIKNYNMKKFACLKL